MVAAVEWRATLETNPFAGDKVATHYVPSARAAAASDQGGWQRSSLRVSLATTLDPKREAGSLGSQGLPELREKLVARLLVPLSNLVHLSWHSTTEATRTSLVALFVVQRKIFQVGICRFKPGLVGEAAMKLCEDSAWRLVGVKVI